ncbi:SUN domain-containing protein 1 isoform X1 [Trichomycterus rosablanca]|uniref:SUN domain-containing protein 1 isoform X1 n=1 Tax=Trichomycterus rosablanca TaxID=2290929 RepID=UPI002F35F858
MSRRSLRLHANSAHYGDDSVLDSSLNRSVSQSSHTESFVQTKSLRSRRSNRSTSGSGSILQTPVKNQTSALHIHNSSMHSCAASDASLLSSLLDESSIQEHTLVDNFWGLDKDGDLKDQTLQSEHSLTFINNDAHVAHAAQTSSVQHGYICKDCTTRLSNRKESFTKACSSSSCSYSSAPPNSTAVDGATAAAIAAAASSSPYTTVYTREKNRRHRAGVVRRLSEAVVHYSRKSAASVACVFTVIMQNVLLKTCGESKGHASYCGTMNLNEQAIHKDQQILNGPLCDDCKGKENSRTVPVSLFRQLIESVFLLVAYTGGSLLKVLHRILSSVWFIIRKTFSALYLAVVSPGSAASGMIQWLGTAWYQLVTLNSLINIFFLTRIMPILRKILLVLIPLLLLFALLSHLSLAGFLPLWPVANVTENVTSESLVDIADVEGDVATEVQPEVSSPQPDIGQPDEDEVQEQETAAAAAVDTERLARIEQSLALLWKQVKSSGGKQDQRHAEVLGLCNSLKDELHENTDRERMGTWVSALLEQKVVVLREELEREVERSHQGQDEGEGEGEGKSEDEGDEKVQAQDSRLDKLEVLLQELALKTEELQKRQETETPLSVSGGEVDGAAHAALLAEVQRLEAALATLRTDLQGVMSCKGKCAQLDSLHTTVSEQIHQEFQTLLYGADQAEGDDPPESLLQWISSRFVSSSDMLTSLAAMEKSILGNLSLQLEEVQQKPSEEQITRTVQQATERTGLSDGDVQLIVQNALKLYSEDRIGLVDYALESGGGSILSTRCSETYETKTALMSLFGFPLWYFSQSPRAVIQPDVHPGNCWAFKGSTGYLVIRLSVRIVPSAFSMEHIPKTLSPTGSISSAPRNFTVYGLDDEQDEEGKLLGEYVYEEDGDALQTFPVMESNTDTFQIVELRVLSNWGHPEYTCLYRFRVHGDPAEE